MEAEKARLCRREGPKRTESTSNRYAYERKIIVAIVGLMIINACAHLLTVNIKLQEAWFVLVIGWTCVGVFVCSAIAAVLSLFRLIRLEPAVKKGLYTSLILAVVGIGVAAFRDALNPQSVGEATAQTAAKETTNSLVQANRAVQQAFPSAPQTPTPATVPQITQTQKDALQLYGQFAIYIVDESQRSSAEALSRVLTEGGMRKLREITIARGAPPDTTEFRYFHFPDDTRLAQTALEVGRRVTNLTHARISYVIETRPSGTIEIHFARS